jgi:hypothetical protein
VTNFTSKNVCVCVCLCVCACVGVGLSVVCLCVLGTRACFVLRVSVIGPFTSPLRRCLQEAYLVVPLDVACRKQQLGEGWFPALEDVPTHAISMR